VTASFVRAAGSVASFCYGDRCLPELSARSDRNFSAAIVTATL